MAVRRGSPERRRDLDHEYRKHRDDDALALARGHLRNEGAQLELLLREHAAKKAKRFLEGSGIKIREAG